jgi:hypothetical protein
LEIIRALSVAPTPRFRTALQSILKQNPSPEVVQAANTALNVRAQSAGGKA